MWWEILPSFFIVGTAIYIPQLALYYSNKALWGNPYRRDMRSAFDQLMFLRDCRIDGAPWKLRGLENIPDE